MTGRLVPGAQERNRIVEQYPRIFGVSVYQRLLVAGSLALAVGLLVFGLFRLEFDFRRLGSGLAQLAWFLELMIPPSPGDQLQLYLHALGETLAIALLGTLLAAVLAFFASFLAARNVVPIGLARFSMRRGFDAIRGIDTLVWALIWINVVGLGPFAGVLAIATSDFVALGKLF